MSRKQRRGGSSCICLRLTRGHGLTTGLYGTKRELGQHKNKWTHWGLSPGPSACEADVIPLHHKPIYHLSPWSKYLVQNLVGCIGFKSLSAPTSVQWTVAALWSHQAKGSNPGACRIHLEVLGVCAGLCRHRFKPWLVQRLEMVRPQQSAIGVYVLETAMEHGPTGD